MTQFQGFKRKPESADIQNDAGNKRPRTGRLDSGLGDEGLGGENDTDGRDGRVTVQCSESQSAEPVEEVEVEEGVHLCSVTLVLWIEVPASPADFLP